MFGFVKRLSMERTEDRNLRIRLAVANRSYPMQVKLSDEPKLREAAKLIESMIRDFENQYSVSDKQDLLAMAAINLAAQLEIQKVLPLQFEQQAVSEIDRLKGKIEAALG